MKFLSVLICLLGLVCGALTAFAAEDVAREGKQAVPPCPDYAQDNAWAGKPASIEKPVDVFYVYPTIYPESFPKNMDIRRDDLRARAVHLLSAQAGVFSGSANLFAPF